MRFSPVLIIVLISLSCSTYKIADRHVRKSLSKAGLTEYVDTIGNYRIHYWDSESDRPVLIFVHGFGASARYQWYKQLEDFSSDFRIVVPNLMYFGESKPLDKDRYLIQDQVELLHTLFEKLNLKKFHLCGVSYGGLTSLMYANKYPGQVEKLVLQDAPVKHYTTKDIDSLAIRYEVPSFKELFAPQSHKTLKKLLSLAFYKPPKVPAAFLKGFYEEMYQPNLHHLEMLLEALFRQFDELSATSLAIKSRVLLIWGEFDDVIPLRVAEEFQRELPGSVLKIIPKTKHMPNGENPKLYNEFLKEFLSTDQ